MSELIDQAEQRCREAFANIPINHPAWCCHHKLHCELLKKPAENRIAYILSNKPENERVVRLNNFRPFKNAQVYADYQAKRNVLEADYGAKCAPLYADYNTKRDALDVELSVTHKVEWPDTTWNGKTIF